MCKVLRQNQRLRVLRGDAGLVESGRTWKDPEYVLLFGARCSIPSCLVLVRPTTWQVNIHGMLSLIPLISKQGLKSYFDSIDIKLSAYKNLEDAPMLLELALWKSKFIEQMFDSNNDTITVGMLKQPCHTKSITMVSIVVPNVLSFLTDDDQGYNGDANGDSDVDSKSGNNNKNSDEDDDENDDKEDEEDDYDKEEEDRDADEDGDGEGYNGDSKGDSDVDSNSGNDNENSNEDDDKYDDKEDEEDDYKKEEEGEDDDKVGDGEGKRRRRRRLEWSCVWIFTL